mgnify:CR=1 FL=1
MSNPFANLGVATQAAEIQMEESDLALAATLDTMRATGAGAGGGAWSITSECDDCYRHCVATALCAPDPRSGDGRAAQRICHLGPRGWGGALAVDVCHCAAKLLGTHHCAGRAVLFNRHP